MLNNRYSSSNKYKLGCNNPFYERTLRLSHKRLVQIVMLDCTCCDCVTVTHAIEFDFGNNWAEAIGQSSYYSIQTGKKAGIVLILETMKDRKFWIRLNTTIDHFDIPIDTWSVGDAAY